jgi:O-acetyl-ADP-ribose deacetylase
MKSKLLVILLFFLTLSSFVQSTSLSLCRVQAIPCGKRYIFNQNGKTIIFTIEQSDITKKQTEAIVNAANEQIWMPGLGGVAKAIFKAAGEKDLADEVQKRKLFCPTGQACVTESYELKTQGVKKIIHAVGPDCRKPGMLNLNGTMTPQAKMLLTNAYQNSLAIADKEKLTSISFPFISSAIFGCNKQQAAEIAISAVYNYLIDHPHSVIAQAAFVLFDKDSVDLFQSKIKDLSA